MKFADLNTLDFNDTGAWPLGIRVFAIALIATFVAGIGYWFVIDNRLTELETARGKERQLLQRHREKQALLPAIGAYRKQLDELRRVVSTHLDQLPTRTEMPDLLEAISRAGVENGLRFERLKPADEALGEIHAIQPLSIRARGQYHQFGAFFNDIASLPRIVTLERVKLISPRARQEAPDDGGPLLVIEATLQTYRYLGDGGGLQVGEATRP